MLRSTREKPNLSRKEIDIEDPVSSQSQKRGVSPVVEESANNAQKLLPQIKEAFAHFLQFVPELYSAMPKDYESELADILWGKLQYQEPARTGLVNVLLNSVDESLLSNYLDRLMMKEVEVLTRESPFRLSVLQFYKQWEVKINALNAEIRSDKDNQEIVRQLDRLATALSAVKRKIKIIDLDSLMEFYCDDELVDTVDSILSPVIIWGPTFWPQKNPSPYNLFLIELDKLNQQRFSKKLTAHDNSLIASETDLLPILHLLARGKPKMPLQELMVKIIKVLVIKSEKTLECFVYEQANQCKNAHNHLSESTDIVEELNQKNATLEDRVFELESKLRTAEAACALVPQLKAENRQLRRDIAHIEGGKSATRIMP